MDLDEDTDDDHAVSCGGGGCNGIAQNGISPASPPDMPVTDCSEDLCPSDPNKTDPGVCGCGVADTDSDSDGTPDCNDGCPDDPGKTDPGICGCGVADTDSDSDGTLDCNDNCPSDPLKTEPGICGCGISDDTAPECAVDCSVGSNSYDFNRSSSHYITIPDDDDLSFGNGTGDEPFSVYAWVKMDDATNFRIASKLDEYHFFTSGADKLSIYIEDDNTGAYLLRNYNIAVTSYEGQWIYVCATYNGNGAVTDLNLYINCVEVDDTSITNGSYTAMENKYNDLYIGTNGFVYADGHIAKVGLWNEEITSADCQDAMENSYAGLATATKGNLVAWWDLDVDTDDDHGTSCGGGGCNGFEQNGISPASPPDMPETCAQSTSVRNASSNASTGYTPLTQSDGTKAGGFSPVNPNGIDSDCNGIDDNGDGIPDNNYVPVQTNCGLGVCESIGQIVCQNGSEINTCESSLPTEDPESTCNDAIDNDCNGLVDIDDQSCSPYIYVEPQGTCGGNWPCYSTIQAGINASGFGSAIKVAQGTYHENIVITEPKEIAILGGWDSAFTSRIEDPIRTTIDGDSTGDGIGDGSVFFIVADTNESMDIFIEGFVIRNGYAANGGGMSIHSYYGSSINLILTNNAIISNNADALGGGVFLVSDYYSMVSAVLIDSTITSNNAEQGGGLYISSIESSTVTVDIENTVTTGNTASTSGDDIFIHENDTYGDSTTEVNASHSDIGDVYLEGGTYNNSQAQ